MAKKSKKIKKLKLKKLKANDVSAFPTPRAWGGSPGIGKSAMVLLDEFALAAPATADDLTYTPPLAAHMLARLAPILRATVKPSKRQWRRWAKANPRIVAQITR